MNDTVTRTAQAADERALLARAKGGDNQALAALYETTYPELYRTVRSMVKNEDDIMDILQDSYLKAFSRLEQLSDGASLRPWLRQIAANTARDHLRRKKPTLFSELETAEDSPVDFADDRAEALPEVSLDRRETQRLVRELLDTLSDEQRLVFGMFYYQQLPVKTIAAQLKLSPNTVKSQLRYGRQKIEKRLRELEKQGVKLCGAAPFAFFRALYRKDLGTVEIPGAMQVPQAPEALAQGIRAKGAAALETGAAAPIKTVSAVSVLLRRVLIGVAALAAVGGIVLGAGALRSRNKTMGDEQPELPTPTVTEAQPTEAVTEDTAPPEETVPDSPTLFADWREAYLATLAGQDLYLANDYYSFFMMPAAWYWQNAQERGYRQPLFFLGDFDGDGTPELMMPRGIADENNMTIYDYSEDGMREYLGELAGNHLCPDLEFYDANSSDDSVTLLYSETDGYMHYNAGTRQFGVEYVGSESEGFWGFQDGLAGWSGADYRALPSYGALSRPQAASYDVRYETYNGLGHFLEHLTLTQTGDEYYFVDYEYVSEADFRAAEQAFLDAADWRSIDETHAPQLADIPGGEIQGPLTAGETVALLGGFDDRPEWAEAKTKLESFVPFGEKFLPLLTDQSVLLQAILDTYPNAGTGGSWSFAILNTDRLGEPAMAARLQQGNTVYFTAIRYSDVTSAYYRFACVEEGNQIDQYLWEHNGVGYTRTVDSSVGPQTLLFSSYDDPVLYGTDAAYQTVEFRPARTLITRLQANAQDPTLDLGQTVTFPPMTTERLRAHLTALLENPTLMLTGEPMSLASAGAWAQAQWDGAITSVPTDERCGTLLLRARRDDGMWLLISMLFSDQYAGFYVSQVYSFAVDDPASNGDITVIRTVLPRVVWDETNQFIFYRWDDGDLHPYYEQVEDPFGGYYEELPDSAREVQFRPLREIVQQILSGNLTVSLGQSFPLD